MEKALELTALFHPPAVAATALLLLIYAGHLVPAAVTEARDLGVIEFTGLIRDICSCWKVDHVTLIGADQGVTAGSGNSSGFDIDSLIAELRLIDSLGLRHVSSFRELMEGVSPMNSELYVVIEAGEDGVRSLSNYSSKFTVGHWLSPTHAVVVDEALGTLLRLDSNFFVLDVGQGTDLEVGIKEVYSVKSGAPIVQLLGNWSLSGHLTMGHEDLWTRRRNLRHTNLVFSALPFSYFSMVEVGDDNATIVRATGVIPEILAQLQASLNFTLSGIVPPDNKWGGLDEDGNWNGMVGQLEAGEVDLVTGGLAINVERNAVMSSTIGIVSDAITLSMKRRPGTSFNITACVEIFHPVTWITVLISGLAIVILLQLIRRIGLDKYHSSSDSETFGALNSSALVTLALLQLTYPVLALSLIHI